MNSNWFEKFEIVIDKLSVDAIFSALLASLIFVLGWIIQIIVEKRKEKKRLKQRTSFLRESISSNIPLLEKQSDKFENLSRELDDLSKRNFSLEIVTDLSFAFYSPNIIEDFHSFIEKNENESYKVIKELSGSINGVIKQQEHLKSNYSDFRDHSSYNEKEWNDYVNQIFRLNDELISEYYEEGEEDDFFKKFNDIIYEWLQERDDANTTHIFNSLINPLRDHCQENLPDARARKILPYLHGATHAYENIVDNRKLYQKVFNRDSKQLIKYKSRLESVVETIDENLRPFRWLTKRFKRTRPKPKSLKE